MSQFRAEVFSRTFTCYAYCLLSVNDCHVLSRNRIIWMDAFIQVNLMIDMNLLQPNQNTLISISSVTLRFDTDGYSVTPTVGVKNCMPMYVLMPSPMLEFGILMICGTVWQK